MQVGEKDLENILREHAPEAGRVSPAALKEFLKDAGQSLQGVGEQRGQAPAR